MMHQIEIVGKIRNTTPLAIGSGETWADYCIAHGLDSTARIREDFDSSNVKLIHRDARGKPFIPGSALKNLIRRALTLLSKNSVPVKDEQHKVLLERITDEHIRTLVGTASGTEEATGGRVLFSSAFLNLTGDESNSLAEKRKHHPWYDAQELTYIETSVGIHRRTGVAHANRLFSYELLPPDHIFDANLLIDDCQESEGDLYARILCLALEAIGVCGKNTSLPLLPIGSGGADGNGALSWELQRVEKLTYDSQVEKIEILKPDESLKNIKSGMLTLSASIELNFIGPFMVRDAAWLSGKLKADDRSRLSPDGKAMLPASGFRGVFRSALERIYNTLVPDANLTPDYLNQRPMEPEDVDLYEDTDPLLMLHRLLGSTSSRSSMQISDFVSTKDGRRTRFEMIGIDRWTGGNADGCKFNVEAFDSPTLKGEILIQLPDEEWTAAALGLLVLTMRDLIEGDLAFGHGVYRGFGACTASIKSLHIDGWQKAKNLQGSLPAQKDIGEDELHQAIDSILKPPESDTNDQKSSLQLTNKILNAILNATRSFLFPEIAQFSS
ncbi:MAG: hypothetical protein KDA65_11370 [Planctomycetaceae bacterium]|nr:hypothetical protein [Planctomycetaceae bacterium]